MNGYRLPLKPPAKGGNGRRVLAGHIVQVGVTVEGKPLAGFETYLSVVIDTVDGAPAPASYQTTDSGHRVIYGAPSRDKHRHQIPVKVGDPVVFLMAGDGLVLSTFLRTWVNGVIAG